MVHSWFTMVHSRFTKCMALITKGYEPFEKKAPTVVAKLLGFFE